jgi:hypothetical protein
MRDMVAVDGADVILRRGPDADGRKCFGRRGESLRVYASKAR